MTKLYFILLIIGLPLLTMFSCTDDNGDCSTDDFVGTWEGRLNCFSISRNDIEIDITKVNEEFIRFTFEDFTYNLKLDRCSVEQEETTAIVNGKEQTIEVNGKLVETVFTFTRLLTEEDVTEECNFTLEIK